MKFWLVLISFCTAALAQFMTLSDFAFMVSQKEKLNIVFDKSVDKNITVYFAPQAQNLNYLQLFESVLKSHNLDAFRVSDSMIISENKVNMNANFSPAGGSINFFQKSPLPQKNYESSIDVTNGNDVLYSVPFGHRNQSEKNASASFCSDCVFEPIKLNFLNETDLKGFLEFSKTKYQYIKNINIYCHHYFRQKTKEFIFTNARL